MGHPDGSRSARRSHVSKTGDMGHPHWFQIETWATRPKLTEHIKGTWNNRESKMTFIGILRERKLDLC